MTSLESTSFCDYYGLLKALTWLPPLPIIFCGVSLKVEFFDMASITQLKTIVTESITEIKPNYADQGF